MYLLLAVSCLLVVSKAHPLASNATENALPRGRIIGGEPTVIETRPYQVSLQYGGRHRCGGIILSEYWALTAAHCNIFDLKYVQIRAGSSFNTYGGSIHRVEKIISHEQFWQNSLGNGYYDVAVVKVHEPFVFDDSRQPADLYKSNETILSGTVAVISGWGYTEEELPVQLMSVGLPVISKDICDDAYKQEQGGIGEGQICAGLYGVGRKDTCGGDSGGPLTIDGRVAGVVSYGAQDCGDPMLPGVYSEISFFFEWINEHVER
ncbi:trypsin-1 [Copidosoma floridanum]|uniref:trypsin-1 n=1 Tax=Copidosoma floridanum TaxID=29053 RepID=UPI0006C94F67|nr:trypsin-1 [Copidosoma floridanum]